MTLKAELHCHIEGAAQPELVERLARKYKMDVSDVIGDHQYQWSDFTSFLNCYDKASSVFRQPDDYRLLAYDYYSRLADQNAIYGEVFVSPDHAAQVGIAYTDMIGAISDGIDDANVEFGIEGRIIVTCIRHCGPEAAEDVADICVANPHPKVTGFGMAGDERTFSVADFSGAFSTAGDAGLGLTAHAGEFAGAESVQAVLDHLSVTRIGHGVRACENTSLMQRLVEEEIVLEVCAGSNVALGIYDDYKNHPFRQLYDAGVLLTLNSDDPPYFSTSLNKEYDIAVQHFGLGAPELRECTETAIKAAFVDEGTRKRLLKILEKPA